MFVIAMRVGMLMVMSMPVVGMRVTFPQRPVFVLPSLCAVLRPQCLPAIPKQPSTDPHNQQTARERQPNQQSVNKQVLGSVKRDQSQGEDACRMRHRNNRPQINRIPDRPVRPSQIRGHNRFTMTRRQCMRRPR